MWQEAYLESRVLSADPVELIRIIYEVGVDSVKDARKHLAAGDVASRSKSISKATAAVAELMGSLDHSAGGEISRNLEQLYSYMTDRLLQANLQQKDELLAEVENLLATLMEGWKSAPAKHAEPEYARPGQSFASGVWQEQGLSDAHTWSA